MGQRPVRVRLADTEGPLILVMRVRDRTEAAKTTKLSSALMVYTEPTGKGLE